MGAAVALRDENTSAIVARLDERLGSVRPRDPESGKSLTAPVARIELLRDALTPATFGAAMGWLTNQRIASDHTARAYADDVRIVSGLLRDELGGPLDIGALTPAHVQVAVSLMQDAKHSARTVNRRLNAVQSLYSYARTMANLPDQKIVNRFSRPKVDASAASANATQAMTRKELDRVYDVCKTARELLAVWLTFTVAGRADELCEADLSHLRGNGDSVELVLSRKGGKVRAFPLPGEVLGLIEVVHGDARSGPILLNASGKRMTRRALDALLKRLGRQAAVWTCRQAYSRRKDAEGAAHRFDKCRECRDVTPHVLRATKLTLLDVEEGWPLHRIQRFADHASPETTAGYIARWHDRQLRAEGTAASAKGMDKYLKRFS